MIPTGNFGSNMDLDPTPSPLSLLAISFEMPWRKVSAWVLGGPNGAVPGLAGC